MNDIMQSASNALKNTVADKCKKMGPEYVFAARVRKLFGTNDKVRDEGLTEPENIVKIKDLAYGNDPEQVLDLYYPSGTGSALPAIVSVHGGGYVYGDKDLYRFYCMSLAQRGFAVVNFSYRLAPGYRFPAQLNDVNAVMQFGGRIFHRSAQYLLCWGFSRGADGQPVSGGCDKSCVCVASGTGDPEV